MLKKTTRNIIDKARSMNRGMSKRSRKFAAQTYKRFSKADRRHAYSGS